MSKFNKPPLHLPGTKPAPGAPSLAAFPTPWCVGPYGSIWVAEDVKQREDDGKWDVNFCDRPRCVVHSEEWADGVAKFIVDTVNAAAGNVPKPPC